MKEYIFNIGLSILSLFIGIIVQWLYIRRKYSRFAYWNCFFLMAINYYSLKLPYNIYFDTKKATTEAGTLQEKNSSVDLLQLNCVRRIACRSIYIGAIGLNLISAMGLDFLATTVISKKLVRLRRESRVWRSLLSMRTVSFQVMLKKLYASSRQHEYVCSLSNII